MKNNLAFALVGLYLLLGVIPAFSQSQTVANYRITATTKSLPLAESDKKVAFTDYEYITPTKLATLHLETQKVEVVLPDNQLAFRLIGIVSPFNKFSTEKGECNVDKWVLADAKSEDAFLFWYNYTGENGETQHEIFQLHYNTKNGMHVYTFVGEKTE